MSCQVHEGVDLSFDLPIFGHTSHDDIIYHLRKKKRIFWISK